MGLWAVLTAALAVSGCAAANPKGAGPAVLYHAPAGRGVAPLGASSDAGHQWVVVGESSVAARNGKTPPSLVTRYLRVDVTTGKTRLLGEMSTPWPLPAVVSPDGQVAVADIPEEKKPFATRLVVLESGGRWRTLVPLDDRFRALEGWSPDSRRLLYERWEVSPAGRGPGGLVVAEVPAGKDSAAETVVVRIGKGGACRAVWSADGRTIYAAIGKADGPLDLVTFAYPSLEWRTLGRVPPISAFTVATRTGDLVWLAPLSPEKGPLPLGAWRMPPGGAPVDTGLRLDKPVDLAVVSPDGRILAVIQDRVTNLILYDLSSSGQQRTLAHGTQTLGPALWLSGGESVVYSEGNELRRVPAQGPADADEQRPSRRPDGN